MTGGRVSGGNEQARRGDDHDSRRQPPCSFCQAGAWGGRRRPRASGELYELKLRAANHMDAAGHVDMVVEECDGAASSLPCVGTEYLLYDRHLWEDKHKLTNVDADLVRTGRQVAANVGGANSTTILYVLSSVPASCNG